MGLRTIQASGAVDELEVGGRRRLSRIAEVAERLRPRRGIDAEVIVEEMLRHFPHGDTELIRRAYEYAAEAHKVQRRASGGAYIEHPANTAYLLAQLGMDPVAIAAGLLHDVPEDTGFSLDDVRQNFGEEVARLVDGVTKLSRFSGVGAEEQQAENIRKMFLAMAEDLRVVVIKLCDRLHNMRTLHPLPPDKQQRIAKRWEIAIADNGVGIAPEFADKIWGLFQTLERRDKVESTGIGLSVVRKIVESHGGRAWVESEIGRGATFKFTWPAEPDEAPRG